jgi:hypothetical protein
MLNTGGISYATTTSSSSVTLSGFMQGSGIYIIDGTVNQTNEPSFKKATVSTELLFKLTKAGRNVLGYIIDRALRQDNNEVVLDHPSITDYLKYRVDIKQANYFNVRRGIKDLIANNVIIPRDHSTYPDTYIIVPDKIEYVPNPMDHVNLNSFI